MSSFHEVRFPTDISYGSRAGPRFSTAIVKLPSGSSERVARWGYPLHVYNVAYGLRGYDDVLALQEFYINRLGPAHGFRFKDPLDFSSRSAAAMALLPAAYQDGSTPGFQDVTIGTGNGTTKIFQLVKKYVDGVVTRTRTVSKPISGTVRIGVNAVEKFSPADWSIDTTTGLVTFGTAPANGHAVTAGFEFDVPVHFAEAMDEGLLANLVNFGAGDVPDILLEEELLGGITADEFYYGGSAELTFSTDVTVTPNTGRLLKLNPGTTGLSLSLPVTTDLEDGGPWFFLYNAHATNAVTIKDASGASQATLNGLSGLTVTLGTFGGSKAWVIF